MKNYYINGIGSISAQETLGKNDFFENYMELDQNVVAAFKPNYKEYKQWLKSLSDDNPYTPGIWMYMPMN